jgi:hypothetical protein
VTLHAGSPTTGYGYQVDLAPQTTIWDSTLDVGQTFTDATLGLYVTTLSTGTDGSLVRVEFGQLSCTQAAPTVVLTPASQFGRDGTTMQMGVSVTNNDGVGCAAAPFSLTAAVPAGWAASFSSLPSLAPGATGSTTLSVAVPAGASGAYPIGVTASNTASALIGTATGSITAATALSVTAAASVSASKSNRTIAVTTAVTSASTALAGAAVQVTIQRPGGATSTLSATTGSDGRASVRLSLKRSDPSGVYQVRVDASQNGVTGSATTAVTVP